MYTNLAHKDIKEALKFTVKLAFKNIKKKFIAVYEKGFAWVNSFRDGTVAFDEVKLIQCIEFLLDYCYFEVGENLYRQHIGLPIGINPGPHIASLTLWYFENRFLDSTYKSKYYIVRKLNNTFRLIDDINTLNSDGYLEEYFKLIYPDSPTLNKENQSQNAKRASSQKRHMVISIFLPCNSLILMSIGAGSIRAIKGGLDKVFKIRDRFHRICRQILR